MEKLSWSCDKGISLGENEITISEQSGSHHEHFEINKQIIKNFVMSSHPYHSVYTTYTDRGNIDDSPNILLIDSKFSPKFHERSLLSDKQLPNVF